MSSGREVTSVNEYPTADGNVGAAGGRDVLYAQVCPLDLPYRAARLFDYKVPTELRGVLRRGDFVRAGESSVHRTRNERVRRTVAS